MNEMTEMPEAPETGEAMEPREDQSDLQFVEQLAALCKLAAELAHREHWKVTGPGSDARHRALEEFYTDLTDLIDEFVETFSGDYDVTVDVPLAENEFGEEIIQVLEAIKKWINAHRDELDEPDDRPLQALIDDIVNRFSRTLFKLRRLQ